MNKKEFIETYKDFLDKEKLEPEEAVVGAGGTCLLLGLRKDTVDMDMAVSEEVFNRLLKSKHYKTHTFDGGPVRGEVLVIEWSNVVDIHSSDMTTPTTMIDGVCSWTPEYTLEFKKDLNRPKDQEDIRKLKEYIKHHPTLENYVDMDTISMEAKKQKKWSGKVKTKWHPPEGFFEGSAKSIAIGLKKNSDNRGQATARLNFYINRAGKNLSKSDKARLEKAKEELAKLYEAEEPKTKKKVSKEEFNLGTTPLSGW